MTQVLSEKKLLKPLALLSLTDKRGCEKFARALASLGYEILSTGGTAKKLREADIPVTDVALYTGFPEILGGRVKTLHPKIYGGILADFSNPEHVEQLQEHGIRKIEVVAVNLYQFAEEAAAKGLSPEEAIEFIDIGGPCMLRAAAKNYRHCLPVVDPNDYDAVIEGLQSGVVTDTTRLTMSTKVFSHLARYNDTIATYLSTSDAPADSASQSQPASTLELRLVQKLRYGENPHQSAGLYRASHEHTGFAAPEVLQGKELSYNNILDLDASCELAAEFQDPAVVIIKHTNPCGAAIGSKSATVASVFQDALATDPKSAFGGIVATNSTIDGDAATAMAELFLECIAAPEFSDEARAIFAKKKNLRLVRAPFILQREQKRQRIRSVWGAYLIQDNDTHQLHRDACRVVTDQSPDDATWNDMLFAWKLVKHVKSNAIVLVKDRKCVAVGAGQMSRVDSAEIAVKKAKEFGVDLQGAVAASDAFFPFRDTVDFLCKQGIAGIIQPGGSKRDQDSIDAAKEHGAAMVFTGVRHFKH